MTTLVFDCMLRGIWQGGRKRGVHGRKRDDFARFPASTPSGLAYVQAVGGVIVFFMLVLGYPQTCYLDSDATIGLYYLYCIIASDFSRLGGSLD